MNYLRDNSYKPQGIHMNPTESQEIFQDWQNVNNSKINVSLLMRKEWRECLKNSWSISRDIDQGSSLSFAFSEDFQ